MRIASPTFLIAALAACLSLTACGKRHKAAAHEQPAATVRAQKVEAKPHVGTEEVAGTVNPKLQSVIEAKVSGRIDKMLVTPGQHVKEGELLAQLDAREVQARLDQASAVREQTDNDLKRFSDLLAKRAVTQQEFEAVQSKARVAKAAVIEAETMLGYTKITAPFDGVITRKLADVGDLALPGKPLLQMEAPNELRFDAAVPEAIIGKVALGAKLNLRVGSAGMEGVVSEIAPAADPNSRTFLVKLDLPPGPELRTGQFGRVEIPVSEISVLRVPVAAVLKRGQMELLFVVTGKRAQLRIVKTGKQIGGEIELVSGIDSGEQVVTEGAAKPWLTASRSR